MSKVAAHLTGSLAALVAATKAEPFYAFGTEKEMADLVAAGFAEGPNKDIVNPDNKKAFAYRATPAGVAALEDDSAPVDPAGVPAAAPAADQAPAPTPAPAPAAGAASTTANAFKVVRGIKMPSVTRKEEGDSKYPFALLGHDENGDGDSFFIPAPDKKSPSKSYGSVVSQANKTYGEKKADFRHFTSRTTTGDNWDTGDGKLKGVKGLAVFRDSKADEKKLLDEAIKAGTAK